MKASVARQMGSQISELINDGHMEGAVQLITPTLLSPTPFTTLDRIGKQIGSSSLDVSEPFYNLLASEKYMGSWVIIASALHCHLPTDLVRTLANCRDFIIQADVWYATDIFGERVAGPALLGDFHPALQVLSAWREDPNRWVRRCVGVALHLWAKRTGGNAEMVDRARELFHLIEPVFEEKNQDAVKGIGWGLKTMGRYYPDLAFVWLKEQINRLHRQPRPLMLRKAITYLPPEQKFAITRSQSA